MGRKKGGGGGGGGNDGGGGGGPCGASNDPVVEEKVKNDGGGGGGGGGLVTVVLRVHMHCDGCRKTVKDSLKGVMGIEKVTADIGSSKLTVVGKVDPARIRDQVERKTRKKVELLSPLPKKDNENKKDEDKPKEKETQASTVVLKIRLHCDGCTQRIRKRILAIKGVAAVSMDTAKDLVTVKGIMDSKALPGMLKEKLRQPVEVVPPNKDNSNDKKKDGKGEETKENGGSNNQKVNGGINNNQKENGGINNQRGEDAAAPAGTQRNYCVEYGNTPYYMQYFSDENPNACSVM